LTGHAKGRQRLRDQMGRARDGGTGRPSTETGGDVQGRHRQRVTTAARTMGRTASRGAHGADVRIGEPKWAILSFPARAHRPVCGIIAPFQNFRSPPDLEMFPGTRGREETDRALRPFSSAERGRAPTTGHHARRGFILEADFPPRSFQLVARLGAEVAAPAFVSHPGALAGDSRSPARRRTGSSRSEENLWPMQKGDYLARRWAAKTP